MRNIIWITRYAPYDKVKHAGGQNCNYYLKEALREKELNIKLITFCQSDELEPVKNDYRRYQIDYRLFCSEKDHSKFFNKFINYEERFSPCNRYANFCDLYTSNHICKGLKELRTQGFIPDIIVLQWTQVILLEKEITKIFPTAKIAAIEEDVAFLGRERKYEYMKRGIKRGLFLLKYKKLKRLELESLKHVHTVFTTNEKDRLLLKRYQIESRRMVSYFSNFIDLERQYNGNKDIVFFGAMNRDENYLSALWFIDQCMPLLDDGFRFLVIGNKPDPSLVEKSSDRIIILGFVESPAPFFASSLCFVAPLQLGAGIKLKVVEAMSAGIPILSNEIGIEGIPAIDRESYIACATPQEYADAINWLYEKKDHLIDEFELKEKGLIRDYFQYEKSREEFLNFLKD